MARQDIGKYSKTEESFDSQPLKKEPKKVTVKKQKYNVLWISPTKIYLSYELDGQMFGKDIPVSSKHSNLKVGDTLSL